MQLTDHRIIKADPATVWAAILDPEVLRACVPGCETLTGSVEDGYEAVVVQKVGPVKAKFTGLVTMSDIVPGQSLTITGEGKGGPAGFAKGGAKVTFEPVPEGTKLDYQVDANVGGKLAQLGSRIIDSFAKKLADEFFARFQTAVEGPADEADAVPSPEAVAAGAEPEAKKGWLKKLTGG
ncbi:CoxG family protein [Frigidibacter sp. MR17.24]|uniref:CoxG family protein n=1 Tax=Frigidibacter sp. MR17.24 TaxID=3127345 RepID=UPI003012CB05